jgi:hypothetical protein
MKLSFAFIYKLNAQLHYTFKDIANTGHSHVEFCIEIASEWVEEILWDIS